MTGFCVCMGEDSQGTFFNRAKVLNPLIVGRLFDRFYTVEVSRSSTGLGLSIAKLLTERMGGRIRANYNEGRLTITLYFHSQDLQL